MDITQFSTQLPLPPIIMILKSKKYQIKLFRVYYFKAIFLKVKEIIEGPGRKYAEHSKCDHCYCSSESLVVIRIKYYNKQNNPGKWLYNFKICFWHLNWIWVKMRFAHYLLNHGIVIIEPLVVFVFGALLILTCRLFLTPCIIIQLSWFLYLIFFPLF